MSNRRSEVVAQRLESLRRDLAHGSQPTPEVTHTAIRETPVEQPALPAAEPLPAGPAPWWPETLRGRVSLTPAHLAALCFVVAFSLGLAGWWVVRHVGQPAEVQVVPVAATDSADAPLVDVAPTDTELVIDVAGKVRRPGVVVLSPGARVIDAIDAAGGARKGVDLTPLNLARPLTDGEQVLVGVEAPAGAAGATTTPGGGTLVNLNTADQATLETLPGVGPVTAAAIIDWRTENGSFTRVEELVEVSGIGPATLAKLRDRVTV
ncbi:ComEA family DNA-binding protein [Nocardioides limicola]|uniref:ComEA family DNA-binding protein n=1 Tax=Nocardioides limicola TaxID=2803368 RepID=UPI00193B28AA|nr:ComEA family DNA-binding protein [Nocardioides sp. DJM-14]